MKEVKIDNGIYFDLGVSFIHSGLMRIEQDSNTNKEPASILISTKAARELIQTLELLIDSQTK